MSKGGLDYMGVGGWGRSDEGERDGRKFTVGSTGLGNSILQGYGGRNGKDLGRNQTAVGAGGHMAMIKGDSLSGEGTGVPHCRGTGWRDLGFP